MPRRNNCKPARGTSTGKMTKRAWTVFDGLPRLLRVAMWESPIPINPVSVADALRGSDLFRVRRRIRDSADEEIARFAEQHRRRYGYELPHVAAHASVQRYEDVSIRRLRPRYARPRVILLRSVGAWAEVVEAS